MDQTNGHDKDCIDNRKYLLQITARTRHRATSPQPCAPRLISPRDDRDMDTVVDLRPCNPCNYFRWEDVAQGSFNQTSFRTKLHIYTLCGPGADCWKGSFEENSIRNRGLPRRATPRKGRSISPKSFLRPQILDVELAATTGFH